MYLSIPFTSVSAPLLAFGTVFVKFLFLSGNTLNIKNTQRSSSVSGSTYVGCTVSINPHSRVFLWTFYTSLSSKTHSQNATLKSRSFCVGRWRLWCLPQSKSGTMLTVNFSPGLNVIHSCSSSSLQKVEPDASFVPRQVDMLDLRRGSSHLCKALESVHSVSRNISIFYNCSISFNNAVAYIQLVVATSPPQFHFGLARRIPSFKVELSTSTFEFLLFSYSFCSFSIKRSTRKALVLYKNSMIAAFAVQFWSRPAERSCKH